MTNKSGVCGLYRLPVLLPDLLRWVWLQTSVTLAGACAAVSGKQANTRKAWQKARQALCRMFPDADESGKVLAFLLTKSEVERLEYFADADSRANVVVLQTAVPGLRNEKPAHIRTDLFYEMVTVKGPKGRFEGEMLVDSGCSMDLSISSHKARQLGLASRKSAEGLAEVILYVDNSDGHSPAASRSAMLEVWVDEPAPGAPPADLAEPTTDTAGPIEPSTLTTPTALEVFVDGSPVKSGVDSKGSDFILGLEGMFRLGVGIDAGTKALYLARRRK